MEMDVDVEDMLQLIGEQALLIRKLKRELEDSESHIARLELELGSGLPFSSDMLDTQAKAQATSGSARG
jgi:hypothetical protein